MSQPPEVQLKRDPVRWPKVPKTFKLALVKASNDLARVRSDIIRSAPVPWMPLVRVHAIIWWNPAITATIHGLAGFHRYGSRDWPAADLAATAALCADEALQRGILVHEFAHCFAFVTRALDHADNGGVGDVPWPDSEGDLYADEIYEREMIADPYDWFSAEDAKNFMHWGDPRLQAVDQRMRELKLWDYLPGETPRQGLGFEQICVPEDVIDHIRDLRAEKHRPSNIG